MTDTFIADYLAKQDAQRCERLECLRPVLLAALRDAGVHLVEVSYDGEGDNGQINAPDALDQDNNAIDLRVPCPVVPDDQRPGTYDTLAELVEDFCWVLLGHYHDGFENNDGGYGTMTIAVATNTITLDHNDRYIEVNNTVVEV